MRMMEPIVPALCLLQSRERPVKKEKFRFAAVLKKNSSVFSVVSAPVFE